MSISHTSYGRNIDSLQKSKGNELEFNFEAKLKTNKTLHVGELQPK